MFTCKRFSISLSLYFPSLSSLQAFLGLSGILGFVVTPLETVENLEKVLYMYYQFFFPLYPEVTPVVNFDATGNENHAAAGGGPNCQGDSQHDQQQLLESKQRYRNMEIVRHTSIMPTSCLVTTKSVLLFIM